MTRRTRTHPAAESFYCSWGKHRTWPPTFHATFPNGTMCLDCQMAIAENLRMYIPMPELTAGLRETERQRAAADKTKKSTIARVRGTSTNPGFIYYILINEQIKIGYSADVTLRMRHYPPGSKLLAVEPGTLHTEKERHQEFGRDLARGREWFTPSKKLMAHIDSIVSELGDPSALTYEYRKARDTP